MGIFFYGFIGFLMLCCGSVFASGGDSVVVSGLIRKPVLLTKAEIQKAVQQNAGNLLITDEEGKPVFTLRNAAGVRVRDLLSEVEWLYEKESELSRFYILFESEAGKTVLFSWNEIFNSVSGEEIYLLAGQEIQGVALVAGLDDVSGKRYLTRLKKIIIRKAE